MSSVATATDIDTFMVSDFHVVFADAAARDAAVPDYIGQRAKMTRGGSWYLAYGTLAGEWNWIGFGSFTPPSATAWAASTTDPAEGDLVTVADAVLATANRNPSAVSATTITLAGSEPTTVANEELIGAMIVVTAGTGSGQRRRILDYVHATRVCTVASWDADDVPTTGSTIDVIWPGGGTVWEATAAGAAAGVASASFVQDLNSGYWKVYVVEDYHYTKRNPKSGFRPADGVCEHLWLGAANRSANWGPIIDDLYPLFPSGGSTIGVDAKWGAKWGGSARDLAREGVIEFTDGTSNYITEQPIKWVPMCGLIGSQPSSQVHITADGTDWDGSVYLVEGAYRNGSTAQANFNTVMENLFLDCNDQATRGVFAPMSHQSRMDYIEIDRFTDYGFHIGKSSDSWTSRGCIISRLIDSNQCIGGWWFDAGVIAGTIWGATVTRCQTAMSFGSAFGIDVHNLETENGGLPVEFRPNNHADINGNGTSSQGTAEGCRFIGMHISRNSTGEPAPISSTAAIAFVRVQNNRNNGLILQGYVKDAASAPYDMVNVQNNSSSTRTFPLKPEYGYNNSGYSDFTFNFDLAEMMEHSRFMSVYTKTQDSRLVGIDNPTNKTGAVTESVTLEPGLYNIEIPAANTYGTDYTVTVNQTPGGTAVPGMSTYSTTSKLARYWQHPGGDMEIVVAGSVGTPSIDVYFRPWTGGKEFDSTDY